MDKKTDETAATQDDASQETGTVTEALQDHTSNEVTSNAPPKKREPSEKLDIEAKQDKEPSPSTSGPKGTEEPGSDEGPGGTGW